MATPQTNEVRAVAKWVRVSPRKAQVVAKHIRGRTVPEARTVLAFTQRAAAREIEKVLRSAVANAESNHGLLGDELVVSAAYIDDGPMLKRWRARARGRAARIRKRTCHITVKLAENPAAAPRREARGARASAGAPTPEEQAARRETAAAPPNDTVTTDEPKRAPRRRKSEGDR